MDFMNLLGNVLKQYSSGQAEGNVEKDFDQVAHAVPSSTLADGLAEAFRSKETPPFAQMAAQLFSNGSGGQQASVLNTLLGAAGPALLSQILGSRGGGSPLSALARLYGGGGHVSEEQAAQVSPEDVQELASEVEKRDPSIVDRLSDVYSEHPDLIKTLGGAALAIAMGRIAQKHQG
jgi:hypothetical protein